MTELILSAVIGYLLGSIPFGLILTKIAGHGDIRKIGSGNIGATNVLRTGNKKLAVLTLLLDGAKGAAAVLLISYIVYPFYPDCRWTSCSSPFTCCSTPSSPTFFHYLPYVAGFFALLGHMAPVWLKFKGGKGVATGLGVLISLSWQVGLAVAATWIVVAAAFRISSLAALVAVALSPVYAFALFYFTFDNTTEPLGTFGTSPLLPWFCLFSSVLIVAKHHANIRRLLKGEEPKIGNKKETTDEHR